MNFVLDYSWDRPEPSWTRRSGFTGVLRYLSIGKDDTGQGLTTDELTSLLKAGLSVGCIWQEDGDAMTGGSKTGETHGKRAREAMQKLKAPKGSAVYFAADSEKITAQHAADYLTAARPALGPYIIGLYGGIDVITGTKERMGDNAAYWWQTAAWSGSRIADRIHLYQAVHRGNFAGAQVDVNAAYADNWGQFTETT
ncbi:glycoside hydrolase domain-containing protein [Streptomyces sp. 5-10]|uniref:glycoside hydrolase domain-containing protein n=1 Tax=Streptomyces sp. 5-10 TaxID=878925 RepID=UPI00168B274F|nr:glycoside hydrolase domain-containing protein [Streptomyces sp. 5-10]MBD3004527.1 DUF1906 domain-containing protein [Streptomyces sp. 5-10]